MKLGLLLTTHTKSLAQTQLTIIISPRGRKGEPPQSISKSARDTSMTERNDD